MASTIAHNTQMAQAFAPVDHNDGAVTGDWIKAGIGHHFGCLLSHADVAAVLTYTFQQATDAAGTGAKALNFTVYYSKEGATDLTAVGVWTKKSQSATNTVATSTGTEAQVLVEFDTEELDVANNFLFVQCSVDDPGFACPGSGMWIITELHYPAQIVESALS